MDIDQDILDFVRAHLRSAWALEQFVFMRRERARAWTIDDLVKELRSSRALVKTNLADFERAGIVRTDDDGRFRFAAATPALDALTEKIETLHRERPFALNDAIWSAQGLRALADAFKIRKDPK